MIKTIYTYFSKPKNLSILNGVLIVILLSFNTFFQAFCIPTIWAGLLVAICFLHTIIYPLLEKTRWVSWLYFIHGISFFLFIYCVLFLAHMNLVGLIMLPLGIGVFTFIPHFFIIQIIRKILKNRRSKAIRYFLASVALCTITIFYIQYQYKKAILSIQKWEASGYSQLDTNFMTEKIVGMHFIYHTKYCEYDGWRPPKHEPILVIGMWFNNGYDPLNVDLATRLKLYKQFFPENIYKFDCSCGMQYAKNYHNDVLWK